MATDARVFVIAEAGVNHNGSMETARRLVDVAADAGADAVKFQTFQAKHLVTRAAPKAEYQKATTASSESQFDMLRALELSAADHETLAAHAKSRKIAFLSTPFDAESLRFLTQGLGMTTVKVSSGDITNAPFLLDIALEARDVIVSTGMSTLSDIEAALGVLAFGFTRGRDAQPGRAAFQAAFASPAGRTALEERVTVLHCTTEYPAPVDEVNLRAMRTIATAFGVRVGYSDHTRGIHIPVAAAALGARVIEKHFTLDRALPGPDHKASLEPAELRDMVAAIREVERAMGDGIKRPTPSELGNRDVARKSLVAARALAAGEGFDITCKRPGTGVSPFEYWTLKARKAARAYAPDEAIDE
jgi:N-acetylneuraminate synthase